MFYISCSIAVIPAAGLGTRVSPLTDYVAKELLPLGAVPALDYVFKELAECEFEEAIIVTSLAKKAYFETYAKRALKSFGIGCQITLQQNPQGLGHAVLCAKEFVGDSHFIVALPDDILTGENATSKLLNAINKEVNSAVLSIRVDPKDVESYGILKTQKNSLFIESLIEKPSVENAPSNRAVVGRYCFSPDLWDKLEYRLNEKLATSDKKELDLTVAMNDLIKAKKRIVAVEFGGARYDIGQMNGYIEAFNALSKTKSKAL